MCAESGEQSTECSLQAEEAYFVGGVAAGVALLARAIYLQTPYLLSLGVRSGWPVAAASGFLRPDLTLRRF